VANEKFRLMLQVEKIESKTTSRILKTEVLDYFGTEQEALKEFNALLDELMEDDPAES